MTLVTQALVSHLVAIYVCKANGLLKWRNLITWTKSPLMTHAHSFEWNGNVNVHGWPIKSKG
jgi:hypothetical protein